MADGSYSQVPAYTLGGLLVAAVLLVVLAVWLGVRLRTTADRPARAVQAGLVGLALMFGALVLAGQRSYGGSTRGARNCQVWYEEAGLADDRRALPGDLSGSCRHAALAAIGPQLGWAALAGLAGAVVIFGLLTLRQRRRTRPAPSIRYVDAG